MTQVIKDLKDISGYLQKSTRWIGSKPRGGFEGYPHRKCLLDLGEHIGLLKTLFLLQKIVFLSSDMQRSSKKNNI